jgi:hypothetical protein
VCSVLAKKLPIIRAGIFARQYKHRIAHPEVAKTARSTAARVGSPLIKMRGQLGHCLSIFVARLGTTAVLKQGLVPATKLCRRALVNGASNIAARR